MQKFRLYFRIYCAKISRNFLDRNLNFHRISNNWKTLVTAKINFRHKPKTDSH